jgi:hypothetical protein
VQRPLARALIVNLQTNERIQVMYNPEEFRVEQGNTFAEVGIPGLPAPPIQYVRGRGRTLTMDLFFDTYEPFDRATPDRRDDVRLYAGQVVRLLDQDPQTKAPPILLFSLGQFQFRCVLTEANQRFTMFWFDGTPVRATLSVRFQEYTRVDFQTRSGFFVGPPTLHTITERDTLSGLAATYLGDPTAWRAVAQANKVDDPLRLPVGRPLVMPSSPGLPGGRPGGGPG